MPRYLFVGIVRMSATGNGITAKMGYAPERHGVSDLTIKSLCHDEIKKLVEHGMVMY